MIKDELCEEPKEMKCEGEGIVSGCKCNGDCKDREDDEKDG